VSDGIRAGAAETPVDGIIDAGSRRGSRPTAYATASAPPTHRIATAKYSLERNAGPNHNASAVNQNAAIAAYAYQIRGSGDDRR